MEYTFSSSIEDKFSTVYAPINYLGASTQLKWYVSAVNGKANAILLDTDDCIIINKEIYYVVRTYTSLDQIKPILNELLNQAAIELDEDNSGRFILKSSKEFHITYITPRLKYALGLYYLRDVNIKSIAVFDEEQPYYQYICKAVHFDYLTPVWYVVSNLGTPTQVSSLLDRYMVYYPAINVKVINTFTEGQPLCISNCDYHTISQASSLANLRFQIMDSDMNPIQFLTPLYITVSVEPAGPDEGIEEAMVEQEQNPNFMSMFQDYLKKNTLLMETLLSKREMGVAVEPEYPPIEEIPQVNQPKLEHAFNVLDEGIRNIDDDGYLAATERPITESFGEGNDDKTEEKEIGISQQQETNIEEQTVKVQEQTG